MPAAPLTAHQRLAALARLAIAAVLGFTSGLPLALSGQAMQAWLSVEGLDIATIGFLSLVGLPYTFKFLWAPLMVVATVFSALALPRVIVPAPPRTLARHDLLGFAALAVAVAVGVVLTDRLGTPTAQWLLRPLLDGSALTVAMRAKWVDLLA